MTRIHSMSRFAEPTAEDERATCQCCGETFYHEALTETGFCPACAPETVEDGEEPN